MTGGTSRLYRVNAKQGNRGSGTIPGFEYFRGTVGHGEPRGHQRGWSNDEPPQPSGESTVAWVGEVAPVVWIRPPSVPHVSRCGEACFSSALSSFFSPAKKKGRSPAGISFNGAGDFARPVLGESGGAEDFRLKRSRLFFINRFEVFLQVKSRAQKAQCEPGEQPENPRNRGELAMSEPLNKVLWQLRRSLG